jgi:hypothetical protein
MKNHQTIIASILAATLCVASPLLANASDHGGGGGGGSSSSSDHSSSSDSHSAPASAPASVDRSAPAPASVDRSAPAPAPVERSAPAPVERSAPAPVANSPAEHAGPVPLPRSPGRGPVQPLPHYQARTPVNSGGGQPAPNPNQYSNQSQSNDDDAWLGATDSYWGDGFWGPLEAGLAAGAYIVVPGSPGYQLLQTYGLTQTPCGPPNLVEILGPDGSKICAFPNENVGPGVYHVDPDTLTLYSS